MKDNITNCSEASQPVNLFNTTIGKVLNKHAPIVTKYFKLDRNSWWSSKCQEAIRKRHRAERLFRKGRTTTNRKLYYAACSNAKMIYTIQREAYYVNKLQS